MRRQKRKETRQKRKRQKETRHVTRLDDSGWRVLGVLIALVAPLLADWRNAVVLAFFSIYSFFVYIWSWWFSLGYHVLLHDWSVIFPGEVGEIRRNFADP